MNYVKSIISHLIERADRYIYIKDTSTEEIDRAKHAFEKMNAIPFPKKFEFDGDIKIGKYGVIESLVFYVQDLKDRVYSRILGHMRDNIKRGVVSYRFTSSNPKLNHECFNINVGVNDVRDSLYRILKELNKIIFQSAMINGISVFEDYVNADNPDKETHDFRHEGHNRFVDAYLATHFDELLKKVKIFINGEEAKKNDYARIIFDWSLEKLADLGRHKKATIEVHSGDSFVKLEFVAKKNLK